MAFDTGHRTLLAACALLLLAALAACTPTPEPTATPEPEPAEPSPAESPAPGETPEATPGLDSGGLLGPEWTVIFNGDLNADGQRDVLGYKPAEVDPDPSLQEAVDQSDYAGDIFLISEAVIVQEGDTPDAEPVTQLTIDFEAIRSDIDLVIYESELALTTPAAFFLGLDTTSRVPLAVLAYNVDGAAFASGIFIYWDEAEQGYRIWPPEFDPAPPSEQITPIPPATAVPPDIGVDPTAPSVPPTPLPLPDDEQPGDGEEPAPYEPPADDGEEPPPPPPLPYEPPADGEQPGDGEEPPPPPDDGEEPGDGEEPLPPPPPPPYEPPPAVPYPANPPSGPYPPSN